MTIFFCLEKTKDIPLTFDDLNCDRTRIEPPQVVTRLLQSDKKRAEKLVQLKNEQLEREKQECTFAPQVQHQSTPLKINSNSDEDIWTRLSKTGSKDVDALQKLKEDKDRRDCTFKPQIHSTPPTSALLIPSSAKSDVYTRLYDDGMRRCDAFVLFLMIFFLKKKR